MNVTRRQFALAASLMAGCGRPDIGVARWRADFPALHQPLEGGRLAYLDNAATTHRPYAVIRAMSDYTTTEEIDRLIRALDAMT